MGKDKIMHFTACAVIALVTITIFFVAGTNYGIAALAGIITSTAAGWGKEFGDKVNPNNRWDWKDILANACGTITGTLVGGILYLI